MTTVAIAAACLAGCQGPPSRPTAGGTIDVHRTTDAHGVSSRVDGAGRDDPADRVAKALAADLTRVAQIRSDPTLAELQLGELTNTSGTPRARFETIEKRVRARLLTNRRVRNHFVIVEPPHRSGSDAAYRLTGDLRRSKEGAARRHRFEFAFSLIHEASGQVVFRKTYTMARR